MKDQQRDFDSEAASWDKELARVKLATDIANALTEEISMTSDMDVLDFGCGTGLLTIQLQPFVHSITAIDGSQGMLNILSQNIEKQNLTNVRTRFITMDEEDDILLTIAG